MTAYFAACTLEFPEARPETWRGTIAAGSPQKAASQAIKAGRKAYPKRRPSSIVVLVEMPVAADRAERMSAEGTRAA